jgi:hypothetical protein
LKDVIIYARNLYIEEIKKATWRRRMVFLRIKKGKSIIVEPFHDKREVMFNAGTFAEGILGYSMLTKDACCMHLNTMLVSNVGGY